MSKVEGTYIFEQAYVLHRLGKNQEALDVLKKGGNAVLDKPRGKHLLSQIVRLISPHAYLSYSNTSWATISQA